MYACYPDAKCKEASAGRQMWGGRSFPFLIPDELLALSSNMSLNQGETVFILSWLPVKLLTALETLGVAMLPGEFWKLQSKK